MKLTKKEKELVLQLRQKEEENSVKFVAKLKHDLFYINCRTPLLEIGIYDIVSDYGWHITKEAIEKIKQKFSDKLETFIKIPKGTLFDCYLVNGEKLWSDSEGYGIEEQCDDFAVKNLTDITKV